MYLLLNYSQLISDIFSKELLIIESEPKVTFLVIIKNILVKLA